MNLFESLRTAWLEINTHKTRSFLSFSALAFGAGSILYSLSVVHAGQEIVRRGVELAGPGRFRVENNNEYFDGTPHADLTLADEQAIARDMPGLYMIYPIQTRWTQFRYADYHADNFTVLGVTPDWRKRDWVYELEGRFLNWDDVRQARRVCDLVMPGGWIHPAPWAKKDGNASIAMFRRHKLLGRHVAINGHIFTVVGILKEPVHEKDYRWETTYDSNSGGGGAIIPITTYMYSMTQRWRDAQAVGIQADGGSEQTSALVEHRITALMKSRHGGHADFQIRILSEEMQAAANSRRDFLLITFALGAIGVFAGGIGIMNVTLATIYSRVKEIGIRRAIGASRRDILFQFLVEAAILGFLGGVAGVLFGEIMIDALQVNRFIGDMRMDLTFLNVLATILLSVGVGLIFSVYPARKASLLDPIEALRYE